MLNGYFSSGFPHTRGDRPCEAPPNGVACVLVRPDVHLPKLEEVEVLYLLAIVAPPVAVLLTGRPIQALLNCLLTLMLWVPGIIHAIFVVNEHKANKRADRLANRLTRDKRDEE